jgi:lipid II:glycine glycyltransferase (peptidoglycan interpeptide bridge formation enzyme)
MQIAKANNAQEWDAFLTRQQFSPFLQSWTMGEVYRDTAQEPIRLEVRENGAIVGICLSIVVPARRGRHLAIPYGPVCERGKEKIVSDLLIGELTRVAKEHRCSFLRLSPFWPASLAPLSGSVPSPLHLLAEHIWYLPLTAPDYWSPTPYPLPPNPTPCSEESILMAMRKTTRNLIRRAEREGVTVRASKNPKSDLAHFLRLHDETRKRHGFTPYTNAFFTAQVGRFSDRNECTLYLAEYQGQVIASSIHMHVGGETSYHHGASTHAYDKIPASYLLQWTAIRDAIRRGDHVYNFWGIAPEGAKNHPFQGVTTFKTGFGGTFLELQHCVDIPLSGSYRLTRAFEAIRKWRRGF